MMRFKEKAALLFAAACFAFTGCGGGGTTTEATGETSPQAAGEEKASGETIKIGLINDQTGDYSMACIPKLHASQLAVEEINNSGGINGKKIELITADTQSDQNKYQEMSEKLILEDEVDVVIGGYLSPGREAVRAVAEKENALYIWDEQYEGGDASHNTFCFGPVPEQQISTLSEAMVKRYGKKAYIISPNYNFGQITGAWFDKCIKELGGEIVGEEYIDLSVSQFESTIANIKAANPDFLVCITIGNPQSSFYEQWAKTGIKGLPMCSTVCLAQTYEHKRFTPPALENMHITTPFMEEMQTDKAKDFVAKFKAKFPDEEYIGQEAECAYDAVYLYKAAVEKAGSTNVEDVIKAFESDEITFDSPSGTIKVDGATHQAYRNLTLAICDKDHKISFADTWENVAPNWLSKDMNIDLRKEAPNKQFTPLGE